MSVYLKKLFIYFSLVFSNCYAQSYNDFSFNLHENAINKVFVVIGEIKGKNDFEVMMIKGTYNWTVFNPKINLFADSSDFTCDVKVQVGPFKYKSEVVGNIKIAYDDKKNEISLRITKAIFELYTVIFGSKIHIKDINLEEYFKDPFVFDGPKSFATDMQFTMPDSTIKKIYIQPTQCVMKVIKEAIVTECNIAASDKPFKQNVKLAAPINDINKNKQPTIKQ